MRPMTLLFALLMPLSGYAVDDLMLPDGGGLEGRAPEPCQNCSRARGLREKADDVRRTGCDLKLVADHARRIGAGHRSRRKCLPSVRQAFLNAGCSVPAGFAHNAVYAFNNLRGVWRCKAGGTAAQAPLHSVIFSVGCGSQHTEFKAYSPEKQRDCYYSDFHERDCAASSEYQGCAYKQIGWCQP